MEVQLLESQPHHLGERLGGVAPALEVGIKAVPDVSLSALGVVNPNPDEPCDPSHLLWLDGEDAVSAMKL